MLPRPRIASSSRVVSRRFAKRPGRRRRARGQRNRRASRSRGARVTRRRRRPVATREGDISHINERAAPVCARARRRRRRRRTRRTHAACPKNKSPRALASGFPLGGVHDDHASARGLTHYTMRGSSRAPSPGVDARGCGCGFFFARNPTRARACAGSIDRSRPGRDRSRDRSIGRSRDRGDRPGRSIAADLVAIGRSVDRRARSRRDLDEIFSRARDGRRTGVGASGRRGVGRTGRRGVGATGRPCVGRGVGRRVAGWSVTRRQSAARARAPRRRSRWR